jgi:hypothetical protein
MASKIPGVARIGAGTYPGALTRKFDVAGDARVSTESGNDGK